MKVYRRYFKAVDVVLAASEADAEAVDSSDASDNMQLDHLEEITAEDFKHMHPSWRDVLPGGTHECLTLAEIFEGVPPPPPTSSCPDCGWEFFYEGPHGGMSINVKCANPNCGHTFNWMGPFGMQPIPNQGDLLYHKNEKRLRDILHECRSE